MFQESLSQKEDYHRALRGFLRELVRQVRQVRNENFPFVTFARGLMQEVESANKLDQIMKVHTQILYYKVMGFGGWVWLNRL